MTPRSAASRCADTLQICTALNAGAPTAVAAAANVYPGFPGRDERAERRRRAMLYECAPRWSAL